MKDQETTQRGDKCKADNKKNPYQHVKLIRLWENQ